MQLIETDQCADLPEIDPALMARIEACERTDQTHRDLMASIEAMHLLEIGGEDAQSAPLSETVTVAAWNMQRCFYPEQSADLLRPHEPDIVLASELDNGMARTHQRHMPRILADNLGMHYVFGVEFLELGLGNAFEQRLAADDHNRRGWHGNAVLSRVAPLQTALIRLDDHGAWFCPKDIGSNALAAREKGQQSAQAVKQGQPRIGGRVAVAALLPTTNGPLCAVSVHLESHGDSAIRQSQMDRLIAALDGFCPDVPIVIGGDLNSGAGDALAVERHEPLFAAAERHGYSWENNAPGATTRRSPLSQSQKPAKKLDWFCSRGLIARGASSVPSLDVSGKVLSDHDVIIGQFSLK